MFNLQTDKVNSYINGYVDKLALPQNVVAGVPTKIKLDRQEFGEAVALAYTGAVNPYYEYLRVKKLKKFKEPEYKPEPDMQELDRQVKEVVSKHAPRKFKRKRVGRKVTASHFPNFKGAMTSLHQRLASQS
jgi:hypothetical protein